MGYEGIHPAVYDELQRQIAHVERDLLLMEPTSFLLREAARQTLSHHVVDRLEELMDGADKGQRKRLRALKRHALQVRSRLEQANDRLFMAWRDRIVAGDYLPDELVRLLSSYRDDSLPEAWDDPPRYDQLDTFVDGLLHISLIPRLQRQPEPEMILYQPTPVRIVLDLLARLRLTAEDVFYDLGSGLGRVPIVVALASPARARGVEFEPAYCAYAQRRARELNLSRVTFANSDARDADYAEGTVFFLYTPFRGKILQRVLERLRYVARTHPIRVCTYGPGTLPVMEQEWLACVDDHEPDVHRGTIFQSVS
jgi:SAM-dependent methyltransferase